jgi:hypothetical protein
MGIFCNLFDEQKNNSAQRELWSFRHKVQSSLLNRLKQVKEQDFREISRQLTALEQLVDFRPSIILGTRIRRVFEGISP